ncbi:MAG: DUF3341 domain-containing protein [Vicinamibacterales bacterium]
MAKKAVFCIATSEAQTERIARALKASGFSDSDISVLFPDKTGTHDFAHEAHTKAPEGATTGATTGGVLGGGLGWLVGIGSLAIPGVGPFIAAGPIMAALAGAAIGAAAGGMTGALVGMGIPEHEAKMYDGKIRAGNVLISVHAETSEEASRAKEIFEREGAQDISSSGESSADSAVGNDAPRMRSTGH